jgi:hypothetical protein
LSIDDLRSEMAAYRQRAEYEAKALRDTSIVTDRLLSFYRHLDGDDRRLANQVISEWVLSDDETVRFDAILLISEFRIFDAVPALHALTSRLPLSVDPGAPYELKKVTRLIEKLELR